VAADAIPSPGQLFGLTLSNDAITPTTVLDIAAGSCADSLNAVTISLGAFRKSPIGGWVAGTGAGGMGSGLAAAASTWYHVYVAIVGGVADVFFDTTCPPTHSPAGTTASRRIGAIQLTAGVVIYAFTQNGDRFDRANVIQDYNGTPGVTTAVTVTLSGVPPGIPVQALISGSIGDNTTAQSIAYLSSLSQTDAPANASAITAQSGATTAGSTAYYASIVTNTSGQIRRRVNSTTVAMSILVNGWIDQRGRGRWPTCNLMAAAR
jgi:hypothetical protein